jgi:hypothetical protein
MSEETSEVGNPLDTQKTSDVAKSEKATILVA